MLDEDPNAALADAVEAEPPAPAEGASLAEGADPEGGTPDPEEPKVTKQPWAHKRIDDLTAQRYEQQRRADAAEARAKELQDRLEAAERARQDPNQPPEERRATPQAPQTQAEFDRAVAARAADMARVQAFNQAANATHAEGVKTYGADFDASLQSLNRALGGLPTPLVEAAIDTDKAALVLYQLGRDPEEAQRIAGLSASKMAIALERIASKPAVVPAVSKVPAPIRPLSGASRGEPDPDKMSTDEWIAARNAQVDKKTK